MTKITTTERLPFPLAKPNPDTFVTQASEIGYNGKSLADEVETLQEVVGMTRTETRVVEESATTIVGALKSDGTVDSNITNRRTTDFIAVTDEKFEFTAITPNNITTYAACVLYDANKDVISVKNGSAAQPVNVIINKGDCKYFRFQSADTTPNVTVTKLVHITGDGLVEDVQQLQEDLEDTSEEVDTVKEVVGFSDIQTVVDEVVVETTQGAIYIDGTLDTSITTRHTTGYIEVVDEKYEFTAITPNSPSSYCACALYNANKELLSVKNGSAGQTIDITINKGDCSYFRFQSNSSSPTMEVTKRVPVGEGGMLTDIQQLQEDMVQAQENIEDLQKGNVSANDIISLKTGAIPISDNKFDVDSKLAGKLMSDSKVLSDNSSYDTYLLKGLEAGKTYKLYNNTTAYFDTKTLRVFSGSELIGRFVNMNNFTLPSGYDNIEGYFTATANDNMSKIMVVDSAITVTAYIPYSEQNTYYPEGAFDSIFTGVGRIGAAITSNIVCIGSSSTDNQGAANYAYPRFLQDMLTANGKPNTVYNFGISGTTTVNILGRSGVSPILVHTAFTIPASGGVVCEIDCEGEALNSTSIANWQRGINPCIINGVEGNMSNSNGSWLFTRTESGDAVDVKVGDMVLPYAKDYINTGIVIMQLGGNNAPPSTDEEIAQMIEYHDEVVRALNTQRYLIFGHHVQTTAAYELAMTKHFGYHYVNVRVEAINHGLEMSNITPTADDIAAIANNTLPPSLMKRDMKHFTNTSHHKFLAPLFYNRLRLMGYI